MKVCVKGLNRVSEAHQWTAEDRGAARFEIRFLFQERESVLQVARKKTFSLLLI